MEVEQISLVIKVRLVHISFHQLSPCFVQHLSFFAYELGHDLLQFIMVHKALSFWVVLSPDFTKFSQCLLADFEPFFILRGVETFQDNSDKEIQEDEGDNDHETDEVTISNRCFSTLHSSEFFHAIIVLGLDTFVDYRLLTSAVVHKLMPRLTSCHSEQSYDGVMEVHEVGVNTDDSFLLNARKDGDSKNRVHEQEQEQKSTDICKLLNSSYESVE